MFQIKTTRLLVVKSQMQFMTVVFIITFHILLLVIAFKKANGLISDFKSYFRDVWNVIDLFIIAMSLSCIVMFNHRTVLVGDFLTKLKYAPKNHFISFDHLFEIEDGLNIVAGLLVCITTIRLWKLLRFAQVFKKLERILLYSLLSLAVLFFCQVVIILGFGIGGFVLFGGQVSYFKSVWISVCSMFYISLNLYQSFDHNTLGDVKGSLGNMYYIFFMFITFTNYTLYVTAIMLGCELSEEYFSKKKVGYTVWNFLDEELQYYWNILKVNPDAGKSSFLSTRKLKVYPKRNATRYDNCVTVSFRTMQAMKAVAKVVLASIIANQENKEVDFELIADAVTKFRWYENEELYSLEEDKELFFVTKDDDDKRILIDNKDLVRMAYIVQQLLERREIEASEPCVERFEKIEKSLDAISERIKNINI